MSRSRLTRALRLAMAAALLALLIPPQASRSLSWVPTARADAGTEAAGTVSEDPATRRAREHYARAEQLFALGHFRKAMSAYEAAYQAMPLPALLFNIGQCHRNLGDYASAVFSFRQYLERIPDAPNRDAVLVLIDKLEAEMRAADRAGQSGQHGSHTKRPPQHGRWWLWTGVATLAVTAAATTIWLVNDDSGVPSSDLGNLDFEHDGKMRSPYRSGGVVFGVVFGLGHGLRW